MSLNFPQAQFVDTNGIRLAYYEMGPADGTPVIFCHGFPELAMSWRQVMPGIAECGFRAIALDQRGYGQSECPPDEEDYAVEEMATDLIGLLDALGLEKAILVGHDWGSPVVWSTVLYYPERVLGVVGVNNPYTPRGDIDPETYLRNEWGDNHYIVNFHNKRPPDPEASDAKFAADTRRFIRNLYRTNLIKMSEYSALPKEQQVISMEALALIDNPPGDLVLNDEELDYFVAAFERTGFTPGINWYRNIARNWSNLEGTDPHIKVPCLMIEVTDDPSGPPGCTEMMRPFIADLESAVIDNCGHWTQHEKPAELTRILADWLTRRFA